MWPLSVRTIVIPSVPDDMRIRFLVSRMSRVSRMCVVPDRRR